MRKTGAKIEFEAVLRPRYCANILNELRLPRSDPDYTDYHGRNSRTVTECGLNLYLNGAVTPLSLPSLMVNLFG